MSKIIKKYKQQLAQIALFVLVIIGNNISIYAQSWKLHKAQADELFYKKQNYYAAAKIYEQAFEEAMQDSATLNKKIVLPYTPNARSGGYTKQLSETVVGNLIYQMAESDRLYKNYTDAWAAYQTYFSIEDNPREAAYLWSSVCLLANNKPELAIEDVSKFIAGYTKNDQLKQLAISIKNNCTYVLQQQNATSVKYHVNRLDALINADGSNYAPDVINDTTFVFTSSRLDTSHHQTINYPSRLFIASANSSHLQQIHFGISNLDVGASCLSANGLTIYFTGWKETYIANQNKYAIYTATRKSINDNWSNPVLLDTSVNVKGYNSKDPFISSNQDFLFFSSNKPRGFGKYDIWCVSLKNGLPVNASFNLGDSVNTSYNEVSPFYQSRATTLFFSSDGKTGMGGLDVHKITGTPITNVWRTDSIMPYPINSVKDDVYYREVLHHPDSILVSSDRLSSCCLEIFSITPNKPHQEEAKPDYVYQWNVHDSSLQESENLDNKLDNKNDYTYWKKHVVDSLNEQTIQRFSANFYFNQTRIDYSTQDEKLLREAIATLKANENIKLVIAAFADCKGTDKYNLHLSKNRAKAIRKIFRKNGISKKRIVIDYYGYRHLLLPCKDDITYDTVKQQVNRRADIILTSAASPKWIPSGNELDIDTLLLSIQDQSNILNTNKEAKEHLYTYHSFEDIVLQKILSRSTGKVLTMHAASKQLHINLFDNGVFDHDSISVVYNGKLMVFKKELKVTEPISFTVTIEKSKKNELILFAENEGTIPPNSALMVVTDAYGNRKEYSVESDLNHNLIIQFDVSEKP